MKKVVNNLLGYNNLKIVQCKEYFNFSLDSVLLANFVKLNDKIQNIMDLGCGNCPMPLILSTKTKAKIIGIEIQKEIYEIALETIKINKLENQIEVVNIDINNLLLYYKHESMDMILSNPPYFKKHEKSLLNENEIKTNARHETLVTLENIISVSSKLLKNKGNFAIVHRTERLIEIISLLKKYKLEPKEICFAYPKKNTNSNIVMVSAKKNVNFGVKILPPLIVHKASGDYTTKIKKMFE